MGTLRKLDVENRLELAAHELLAAEADLIAAVGDVARIRVGYAGDVDVDYPCCYVHAVNFTEETSRTGWYSGLMRLGACTYRADDSTLSTAKAILGWLRGFAQLSDLVTQLNGTTSATTAATALTVAHVTLAEAMAYEMQPGTRVVELALEPWVLCRPSNP
jgi:hypothetical protein